jgi:hypothetical protein
MHCPLMDVLECLGSTPRTCLMWHVVNEIQGQLFVYKICRYSCGQRNEQRVV